MQNIIDAHHHLWLPESDPAQVGYVWLKKIGAMKPFGDPTPIQRDYSVDEFKAESKQYQLIGSVHVQADGAIPDPVRESEWLEMVAEQCGLPTAHVGFLDLSADTAQAQLERYVKLPRFRGIRQILSKLDARPEISFAGKHYVRDPQWRAQFGLLAEHQLRFDLQLYPEQMAEVAAFLADYPTVTVIIDHAGSPYDQSAKGLQQWQAGLSELAALPQCSIKLSGFGMFDKHWSSDRIQPLFEAMLDLFGAERLLFGSNFPVDKLMCSYDQVVSNLITCTEQAGLNQKQIDTIFVDNAKRIYGLAGGLSRE